ncbi:MAG: hypothetical protein MJZ35_04270 [Bacteroidaceae bacterium]|nr:hypothetical protein [Bacteroidaceae bacterium]
MSLFSARQPRKYRPRVIYRDERKEKLQKLVNEVRRSQGEEVHEPYDVTKFNGTFSQYTPHAQRASERSSKLVWPVALFLIIILIFVWHYLLTGRVHW